MRAQSGGSGGVVQSAPAGQGSGFATVPEAGATVAPAPRQKAELTPRWTPRAIADELDVVTRHYEGARPDDPVSATMDAGAAELLDLVQAALTRLKVARFAALDNGRVQEKNHD